MYTEFFGLNEKPFAITPDPRYLYMSARHTDALAHLLYGISESGGFIQLTGEVGTGKTTLIRSVLEQLLQGAASRRPLRSRPSPESRAAALRRQRSPYSRSPCSPHCNKRRSICAWRRCPVCPRSGP